MKGRTEVRSPDVPRQEATTEIPEEKRQNWGERQAESSRPGRVLNE